MTYANAASYIWNEHVLLDLVVPVRILELYMTYQTRLRVYVAL